MDYSVNTQPLLQPDTESDFENDLSDGSSPIYTDDAHIVATKDTKPLCKTNDPQDRYVF